MKPSEIAPGLRRGCCPRCLGAARAIYSRVDFLADESGIGSYVLRGVVACVDSGTVVNAERVPMDFDGHDVSQSLGFCLRCRGPSVQLFFQQRAAWIEIPGLEGCRKCRLIQNAKTGATLSITEPLSHEQPSSNGGGPAPAPVQSSPPTSMPTVTPNLRPSGKAATILDLLES
jgi:hypothetical protein